MIVMAWVLTTIAQSLVLSCLSHEVLGVHVWEMSLDDAIWETTVSHYRDQDHVDPFVQAYVKY